MNRTFVGIGGFSAAAAVALGAFGAHGLRDRVSAADLAVWETAAHYHLIHAIALVAIGFGLAVLPSKALRTAGWLILTGQFIFGGTLYALVLLNVRWLGAITPIGGVCLIVGWVCLAIAAFGSEPSTRSSDSA